MKTQSSTGFTFLLGLIVILFVASKPYQTTFDKITVKEFEMVDQNGKKRASIKVEPDGEVVFRMLDNAGTIRVKIGAGQDGSGLVLLDNNTEPGIQVLAKKSGASISIIGKDGKKKEF